MLRTGLLLNTLQLCRLPEPYHEARSDEQSLIHRIGLFIYRHIDRPIQIRDLAEQFAMSESHLRNLFRKKTGRSLGRYLHYAKLNEAQRLLTCTNLNMDQIAGRCGFASSSAFSRAFQRAYTVSPTTFRKQKALSSAV